MTTWHDGVWIVWGFLIGFAVRGLVDRLIDK
jgi:hypothetical protein